MTFRHSTWKNHQALPWKSTFHSLHLLFLNLFDLPFSLVGLSYFDLLCILTSSFSWSFAFWNFLSWTLPFLFFKEAFYKRNLHLCCVQHRLRFCLQRNSNSSRAHSFILSLFDLTNFSVDWSAILFRWCFLNWNRNLFHSGWRVGKTACGAWIQR